MEIKDLARVERLIEDHSFHEGRNRLVHAAGQRLITIDIFAEFYNLEGEEDTILFECADYLFDPSKLKGSEYSNEQEIPVEMLDMYYTDVIKKKYFDAEDEAVEFITQQVTL